MTTHIARCWAALNTTRWHANPALSATMQTVADHHGRCIALLVMLYPGTPSPALVTHLALHDLGEGFAGDLPGPFKGRFPDIARFHAAVESELASEALGWDLPYLTEVEAGWVRMIDRLDAAAWCLFHGGGEYDRAGSGWDRDERVILTLAETLGVIDPVLEFLGDLKGGRW